MKILPSENIYGHTKKLKYFLNEIKDYINQSEKKTIKVIDFGCGNGSAVSQYIIDIDEKIEYYGIDFHEPSINYAKKNYASHRAFFSQEIPNNKKDFDIILYSDVIEHLYTPFEILSSHTPLLAKNGIMLGSVPNGYGPFEIEKKLVPKVLSDIILFSINLMKKTIKFLIRYKKEKKTSIQEVPYNSESGHVQFFTKKKLLKLLNRSGYQTTNFKNAVFLGAPPISDLIFAQKITISLNSKIADYLPYWLVSGWYFTCIKHEK